LWVARYILLRIAEHYGVGINWDCKPIKGNWNGAGLHINCSTSSSREVGNLSVIFEYVEKLKKNHDFLVSLYGIGNEYRLNG
jgi:glutamine synthetase